MQQTFDKYAMHKKYGTAEGKCRQCSNFKPIKKWTEAGQYAKCLAYGVDNTEATDWLFCLPACGLMNVDFRAKGILPLLEQQRIEEQGKQQTML